MRSGETAGQSGWPAGMIMRIDTAVNVRSDQDRWLDSRASTRLGHRGAVASAAVSPDEGCVDARFARVPGMRVDDRRQAAVERYPAHTDPGRPRDGRSGVDPPAGGQDCTDALYASHPTL